MEIERPHRSSSSNNNTSTTSSELFICFTSRLSSSSSSSSMKISSKSILSPGRPREPTSQISLSTSLSRRLRSNGSLKGGQASPMFPAQGQGKKRRAAFENPEPSSPKVTCIGQVRVKTKKQGRKMRTRSKRRNGEISFRRAESGSNSHADLLNQPPSSQQQQPQQAEHRNQRWVHLPMTICEALRALGTDLNCFLPCRSPCMAGNQKEKEEKAASGGRSGGNNGCGAVFARWLVSLQDGEGKGREIELVVGGGEEEEEEEVEERRRSYRRHVFEEIEFKEDEMMKEEARVSICVPPKNALLLMRCRSDPVRMAALSNRFCEAPHVPNEAEEEEEASEEEKEKVGLNAEHVKHSTATEQEIVVSSAESEDKTEVEQKLIRERSIEEFEEAQEIDTTQVVNLEDEDGGEDIVQQRNSTVSCRVEQERIDLVEQEIEQENGEEMNPENEIGQEDDKPKSEVEQEVEVTFVEIEESAAFVQVQELDQGSEFLPAGQYLEEKEELTVQEELKEEMQETRAVAAEEAEEEETTTHERSESDDPRNQEGQMGYRIKERTESSQPLLPDCLLLMMCEPKLSMEVSKETWVCSTDFIRSLPHHHPKPVKQKQAPQDEPKKKRNSIDCDPRLHRNKTLLLQPARSSCSYPARPPRAGGTESMSNMIEKKLVGAKAGGYEPLMLKRCKSEPMRTANKLAAGELCFWKNRKLEPHRPATVGVGTAGFGVGV